MEQGVLPVSPAVSSGRCCILTFRKIHFLKLLPCVKLTWAHHVAYRHLLDLFLRTDDSIQRCAYRFLFEISELVNACFLKLYGKNKTTFI